MKSFGELMIKFVTLFPLRLDDWRVLGYKF
jgi:hypothetical protein